MNTTPDTTPAPLAPITLDALAVYEPDRDNEAWFNATETWANACDAIRDGHPIADVAAALMELPEDDLGALALDWRDHTLDTLQSPAESGRDINCPDIQLAMALIELDPARDDLWSCVPALSPESIIETVQELGEARETIPRLTAERDELLEMLRELTTITQAAGIRVPAVGRAAAMAERLSTTPAGAAVAVALALPLAP